MSTARVLCSKRNIKSAFVLVFLTMACCSLPYLIQRTRVPLQNAYKEDLIVSNASSLRELHLPRCGCSKKVVYNKGRRPQSRLNITCEVETAVRGPHQKVIAFTYYEPSTANNTNKRGREYFDGIKENLTLLKRLYPGWIMRLYYQISERNTHLMERLCGLACEEPQLDICDISRNARLGNATVLYPLVWRFLAAVDVQVDLYLSRDLDSRVNEREVAAVNDFLSREDKLVHNMRDHPAHNTYIMGGMWGAKAHKVRPELEKAIKGMFKDGICYGPRSKGGYDQICLAHYVWPWAKKVMLTHDSYHCQKYSRTTPFPTRREPQAIGNYVGSVVSLNASITAECPKKCRPKDHQDWIYC